MILVSLIGLLMAGGLLAFFAGQWNTALPRWIALLSLLGAMIMLIVQGVQQYNLSGFLSSDLNVADFRRDWIPSLGISFHLAIDGLSYILLVLTIFTGVLAIMCSWNEIQERVGFFHFNVLWVLAGVCGVFLAMDLFLFYFFWEVMLIPMYFLIVIWGSENREYAAYKFFIFTQASGLLMFLSILGLYFIHASATGIYTFNYFELLGTVLPENIELWLISGFMIAFVVKLPVFPFHTWLPDAHGEAPTAGSLILASLLLKTGAYGMFRFALPLFPEAARDLAPLAMGLGVVGIIYGAVLAFSQTDLKRLIAYTSVSHMGFVILGIFAFNELACQGVVIQLVTHAISTGALFLMAGMLKERLHTRDINQMGGLWSKMPQMGAFGIIFAMASIGLPGLGNFIAEFLILLGTFKENEWFAVIASLGLIFSAVYSLRFVQKIFLGSEEDRGGIRDFSLREKVMMALLLIPLIWLGIYPQAMINQFRPVADQMKEVYLPDLSKS